MLRSKRGPALFDYLTSGETEREPSRAPRAGTRPSISAPPESMGITSRTVRRQVPSPVPGSAVITGTAVGSAPAGEEKSPSGAKRVWIEMEDERIRLSFSSLTAAAAVFVLLMTILASFEFGKRRGENAGLLRGIELGRAAIPADASNDLEAIRQQPPTGDVVRSLVRDPNAAGSPGTPDGAKVGASPPNAPGKSGGTASRKVGAERWVRGKTYIVVQEFAAEKEEFARRAQEFLASKSIPSAIVGGPVGSFRLITTDGFNRQDASERRVSEQALARIHALGEEFYRDGGGYKLQGYFATLKGDGW